MISEALYHHDYTRPGATLPRRDLFDRPTGDLFAGWGGFTLGKEMATGRTVDFCVNHSATAIEYHAINHPHSRHYICDVHELEPSEVTDEPLLLLLASPDCTHFSPARGSAPVSESVRSLAWVLVKYAGCAVARPDVLIVENVPAFTKWGPIHQAKYANGKLRFDPQGRPWMVPIPGREGEEFAKWVKAFHDHGYTTDWWVLDAADFGVPQHRRRFFFIARCDGLPIVRPSPTHGPAGSGLKPYRTAAQCIDWSLPCPSILMNRTEARAFKKATGVQVQRPLAENTLSRTGMGVFRFVLENADPFIVDTNHAGDAFRGQSVRDPMATVSGAHGQAVVVPSLVRYNGEKGASDLHSRAVDQPIGTVPTENRWGIIAPTIATIGYGEREGQTPRARRVDEPMTTVVGEGIKAAIVEPVLIGMGGSGYAGKPRSANRPAGVVKCDDRRGVVTPIIAQFNNHRGGIVNEGQDAREPSSTVVASGTRQAVVAPTLIPCGGPKRQPSSPDQPYHTVLPREDTAVTQAFLVKFRGTSDSKVGASSFSVDAPAPAITGGGVHEVIAAVSLVRMNHGDKSWNAVTEPAPTVTTGGTKAISYAVLMRYHGSGGQWSNPAEPVTTITAMEGKAVIEARAEQVGEEWPVWVLDRARQVAGFLRKYVGRRLKSDLAAARKKLASGKKRAQVAVTKIEQQLARFETHFAPLFKESAGGIEKVGELVLLSVRGLMHVMVDIGLRMFTPRELARCQSFPDSYVLPKSKNVAVKLIGNSVPPLLVEALIRANLPELCVRQRRRKRA